MVEFALVSVVALAVFLGVLSVALVLWERNMVMASLSEGARVAATRGRTVADGRRSAATLLEQATLGHVTPRSVAISGAESGGVVVLRARGRLRMVLPGFPTFPVSMTASMHKEESL